MNEEDEFDKLPNDLMVDILSRLNNDAKFLTQTLALVNKRIASLITSNITSVSTTIPNPNLMNYNKESSIDYSVSVDYLITTRCSPSSSWKKAEPWESNREIPPSDFFACKAREKLERFSGLQNAKIEYPNFEDHTLGGIIFCPLKWKVEYSGGLMSKNGGGRIIKSCALLGVDTILAGPNGLIDNGIDLHRRLDWLAYCFKFGLRFHPMAVQMARDHQYLRDISITSNNTGQRVLIHAGEEEIIKMRQEDDDDQTCCCMHMKVKMWHVPVMDIPIGLRISGATFVVATSSDDYDDDDDDDDDDDEIKEAARRFWGYNGAPEDCMTKIIDMAEAGMATVVDKKCTMEINTIWHWTAH